MEEAPTFLISERGASLARLALGLTSPLAGLCVATLAARFYVRIRPVYKVGWDDWSILLGTVRHPGFLSCPIHPSRHENNHDPQHTGLPASIPIIRPLYPPSYRHLPSSNPPAQKRPLRNTPLTLCKQIFAITCWALLLQEMYPEPGYIVLSQASRGVKYGYLAIALWTLSMGFTKIGVAITLLRIRTSWRWNLFLYSIIGIQGLYIIGNTQ